MEVDADGEIDSEIKVNIGEGHLIVVSVTVPWLPEKCITCKQFGHDCSKKSIEDAMNQVTSDKVPSEACEQVLHLLKKMQQQLVPAQHLMKGKIAPQGMSLFVTPKRIVMVMPPSTNHYLHCNLHPPIEHVDAVACR